MLLGAQDFLPLGRTVAELPSGLLGVRRGSRWLGVLSLAPDDEPAQTRITGLAVHPDYQRRGIARALLTQALSQGGAFSVVAGAHNAPALALYQGLGFEPYRWGTLGPQALPMVKLRRTG